MSIFVSLTTSEILGAAANCVSIAKKWKSKIKYISTRNPQRHRLPLRTLCQMCLYRTRLTPYFPHGLHIELTPLHWLFCTAHIKLALLNHHIWNLFTLLRPFMFCIWNIPSDPHFIYFYLYFHYALHLYYSTCPLISILYTPHKVSQDSLFYLNILCTEYGISSCT